MAAYTTPADIKARWLSADPLPNDEIIAAWIDDAETLIFSEIPDLADQLQDDPDGSWAKRLTYVTTHLVSGVLKNPEGVRQRSQTAGAFTDSITFGSETIAQAMTLTPMHRAMLTPKGTKRHSGIDMTTTTPENNPLAGALVNGPDHLTPGRWW